MNKLQRYKQRRRRWLERYFRAKETRTVRNWHYSNSDAPIWIFALNKDSYKAINIGPPPNRQWDPNEVIFHYYDQTNRNPAARPSR